MAEQDGDRTFEARLERLFAQAPDFGDADLFALRVSDRLDRGWTLRGAAIGALGLVGGVVLVVQAGSNGVLARAESLSDNASTAIGRALDHVLPWRITLSGVPLAGEVVWIPVALAALALGYAISRAIREI
jgi:hypothetical protein